MKKLGFISGLIFLTLACFAQYEVELTETVVQPPNFNYEGTLDSDEFKSPICQYLHENLSNQNFYDNGVVIVLFTVKSDGTLTDFQLENSVSNSTDNAVIRSIESTSGMWNPGIVNGSAVDMQKALMVKFIDPENGTLEDLAQNNLEIAIRKYHKCIAIQNSLFLTAEKADRKIQRKLASALRVLDNANQYQPNEPAIVFWQARVYEQAGQEMMKNQKLDEFKNLVNFNYSALNETIEIVLK
ncbi:hypothetical protein E9993_04450 [Labilibacter sediminis]|nr:hypothetical protein E9993_04450 [Labilibacter sediminis]